jgi:cytochrome subunit of sulfide dehydrogenase
MKKLAQFFAVGLVAVYAQAHANDDLKFDPEAMAWLCAPCHGTMGREFHESMPGIAGLDPDFFTKIMIDFREGRQATTIMDRVARGFTDTEIKALALWFAEQPTEQWNPEEFKHDH